MRANSVDLDEVAHDEPPRQDLHCLHHEPPRQGLGCLQIRLFSSLIVKELNSVSFFLFSAVRFGRVPKRSKSLDEQRVTSTDASLDQTALENKQLAIYDIILNVSQAHHAHCGVTEDKLKNLERKHSTLVRKFMHCCIVVLRPR